MSATEPALLLTGATGLVGGELLPSLLAARPDRRLVVLARRPESLLSWSDDPRVRVLAGDLGAPHLGLDAAQAAELRRTLTEIIHCAAGTRFDLPIEEAREVNVGGTAKVLELARACRRLEKFAHVSTVYVAGRLSGLIPEALLRRRGGFCNSYQQSKREAEELVAGAMGEIPAAIFRLSSIIGDSATGRVRQFNHVHQLLKLFPQNVLPVAPGAPGASIDMVPTDWAVGALAHLYEQGFAPGRVYQICAGPQGSLKVREMMAITQELFETHPAGRRWLPIRVPKLVSLPEYERWADKSRRAGDRLLNELLRVLGLFLPHLGIRQAFDNQLALAGLAGSGLVLPPVAQTYRKVVAYCLETDWGRRLSPSP